MATTATVKIEKFLGLNISDGGDTNLKVGELSTCDNIRIIDNYKARKREGYTELFNSIAATSIKGMWYGSIGGSNRFLFSHGGYIYRDYSLSGTIYDSLDTATYTHVDVVKTTALDSLAAGTTAVDGATIVKNSSGTELTEIAQANIDLVASVGKYYYHTDKTIWLVVAKGAYADVAAARTGLGTYTVYHRIGSLTNAATSFFTFGGKVYIQNGSEYYSWSGTGATAAVAGYVPVIATATPPAGGGTDNEGINVLTGKKSQYFSGNASATTYQLRETAITSVDAVRVGGVTLTATTNYTVNLTNGTVDFSGGTSPHGAPASGTNNVEIDWTKGSGTRSVVTGNKYAVLFGGQNDSRVFLYGDGTNEIVFSGLADGVPSAEYFPVLNISAVGSSEYPITYVTKQYDRQIIYTTNNAYYSVYEYDETLGTTFPIYPLNDKIGNLPYGQGQLIQNNPFTVDLKSVYEWIATSVRDERNANYKSLRVQPELDELDMSAAVTTDFEKYGEYWLCSGLNAWIYNYRLDVWYKFVLSDTPTCFLEIDGVLYFGTSNGQIMYFDEDALTDNGTKIADLLETGDIDFGENWKRKFLNFTWIGLQPEGRSKANIGWVSDYATSSDDEEIGYNSLDFGNIDFDDFSFQASYSPQPFRIKTKAKKFTYLRLVITCDSSNHKMTLLSITMPAIVGGVSK